jgi:peptidylprolyl isomerase/peptidyl-prolyl cis-trans isomerase D
MPLLTRIRESMTKIFAIFAGVFIVYIVLDWGMDLSGQKGAQQAIESQMVGFIDGEGIPFRDFSDLVQQNIDAQRAQTGNEPEEYQVRMVRDQVWNSMVTEKLYEREIERLGLSVSDQEIVDAVRGDNPPDFLRSQFTDSTGTFNRAAYDAAITDPRNRQIMVNLERAIRQQNLRSKLQSVVLAGVTVTEGEVAAKFADDNLTYGAEVLAIEPALLMPDSAVKATEADLRAYYDRHIEDYRLVATRKVKYVSFPLVASTGDTDYVRQELEDIRRRVLAGASFEEIAASGSDAASADAVFRRGELEAETERAVFGAAPGDIVGPILENDGFHLINVIEFTKGKDDYIHAQHVLIRVEGSDSAAAREKARDVLAKARSGQDFGELAARYSTEPGAAQSKGDLGWFGKGRMVKAFEEAAFAAKPGQIVGPVKTEFGYHVIKVLARDNKQARVRDIMMEIEMTPKSQGEVNQKAQDFAYFAKENGLEKEAELKGLEVAETPAFTREGNIGGIGTYRAINRFAFEGEIGDVSDAIPVNKGYAICMISEAMEARVRPFDEVKAAIEVIVRREIKTAKAVEFAAGLLNSLKPGDSLGTLAASAPGARVERIDSMRVSSSTSMVGRDPAVIGALEALSPGQVSKPVTGMRSVYVVRLLNKSAFDSTAYAAQRSTILARMLQQKRERYFTTWTEKLKEGVEVDDRRDLFYR